MTELAPLLLESCARCGRPQTALRAATGATAPTCVCCGGAGLSPDRACRHQGPAPELALAPALICQRCGGVRESVAHPLCDRCRTAAPPPPARA